MEITGEETPAPSENIGTKLDSKVPKVNENHSSKKVTSSHVFLFFFPKKKPSEPKQAPSEPTFIGLKLKKAQTVKRQIQEEALESITLKHHEFEKIPLEEEVPFLSNFYVDYFNLLL